ncbi:MAG: hypothetical protein HFI43_01155 [Lachnospiraceae bacterium]|jgi:hypothetical protein|nr:hypothetical protein [Lachnospiraceae bacterium]
MGDQNPRAARSMFIQHQLGNYPEINLQVKDKFISAQFPITINLFTAAQK